MGYPFGTFPIPSPQKLLGYAYKLFNGNFGAAQEPVVATFSRGIVDLNNNLLFDVSVLPAGAVFALMQYVSFPLVQGQTSGQITGMNWPSIPALGSPVILAPSSSSYALAVAGIFNLTTDGFSFNLNGPPDSNLYTLKVPVFFLGALS